MPILAPLPVSPVREGNDDDVLTAEDDLISLSSDDDVVEAMTRVPAIPDEAARIFARTVVRIRRARKRREAIPQYHISQFVLTVDGQDIVGGSGIIESRSPA